MNLFKTLVQKLRGMKQGYKDYRAFVDAGKVVAPIASSLVTNLLKEQGYSVTPNSALHLLALSARSTEPLYYGSTNALARYVSAHFPVPGEKVIP